MGTFQCQVRDAMSVTRSNFSVKKSYILCLVLALTPGCKSLFPVDDSTPQNHLKSYEQAQSAFNKIIPHQTTTTDLKAMGFDPMNSPNLKVLTYLDVIQRFLPNQSINKYDLPIDVLNCLEAKDKCKGYELVIESSNRKRYGNLPLDILGFKKNTRVTGWSFRALLVIQHDIVTYKLASGEPNVDRVEKKTKPLGPFQELDGMVSRLPGMM